MSKNAFYFILKTLFILKIFKFLVFLVNKQLQYTYYPILHEVKGTK